MSRSRLHRSLPKKFQAILWRNVANATDLSEQDNILLIRPFYIATWIHSRRKVTINYDSYRILFLYPHSFSIIELVSVKFCGFTKEKNVGWRKNHIFSQHAFWRSILKRELDLATLFHTNHLVSPSVYYPQVRKEGSM